MTRRTPCGTRPRVNLRHFHPLIGFVVPTAVIGYGIMIPRSCIAGWNDLTLGFSGTIVGAAITYWVGVRRALRDGQQGGRDAVR